MESEPDIIPHVPGHPFAASCSDPNHSEPRVMPRDVLREALAETLHDAMCDISHHDRDRRCSKWGRYPNIAASVAPRLAARLAAVPSESDAGLDEDAVLDAFYRAHILRVYKTPKAQAEKLASVSGKESWRLTIRATLAALRSRENVK